VQWEIGGRPILDRRVFEVVLKDALCRSCNSGWLSDQMERKVSKWLKPWLRDVNRPQVVFDEHQRTVLAAWAVKTALLLELALADVCGTGFAPERHFRWLYQHRASVEPPPHCSVWMFGVNTGHPDGGLLWTQLAWTKASAIEVAESRRILIPGEPETLAVPRGYLATFTAGFVGFQVLSWDLDETQLETPPTWYRRFPS
jgi:hypothetical protein